MVYSVAFPPRPSEQEWPRSLEDVGVGIARLLAHPWRSFVGLFGQSTTPRNAWGYDAYGMRLARVRGMYNGLI